MNISSAAASSAMATIASRAGAAVAASIGWLVKAFLEDDHVVGAVALVA